MRILTLVAVATLLGFPSTTFAQATGTGTVVGRISDSSGAVLPGVTVSLEAAEALGQFSGVDRRRGQVPRDQPAAGDLRGEGGALGLPDRDQQGQRSPGQHADRRLHACRSAR